MPSRLHAYTQAVLSFSYPRTDDKSQKSLLSTALYVLVGVLQRNKLRYRYIKRDLLWGIGSLCYECWEAPWPVICKLEVQESWEYRLSPNPKTWEPEEPIKAQEPGAPISVGRRRQMSQLECRENSLILYHLLLGRKAITNLDSMLKSRDITLPTRFI